MYQQPVEFGITKYGPMLYPAKDKYVAGSLREYGEYSPSEINLIRDIIRPGWVCLDVGANVGVVSLAMSTKAGRVIAIEPQYFINQLLVCNASLSGKDNIDVIQAAVGKELGKVNIPVFNYNNLNNYGAISYQEWGQGQEVDMITIDSLRGLVDREFNFIKLDVEGMELEVLKGARKTIEQDKPLLWVENDKQEKSKELVEYVYSMGYIPYWVITLVVEKPPEESIFPNQASFNMLCVTPGPNSVEVKGFRQVKPDDCVTIAQPEEIYFYGNPAPTTGSDDQEKREE